MYVPVYYFENSVTHFSQKLDIKRGQEPVASIRKINALPGQQLNYLPTRKTKKFL